MEPHSKHSLSRPDCHVKKANCQATPANRVTGHNRKERSGTPDGQEMVLYNSRAETRWRRGLFFMLFVCASLELVVER